MKPKSYHDLISLAFYPPIFDFFITLVFVFAAPQYLGSLTPTAAFAVGLIFLTAIPLIPVPMAIKRGHVDFNVSNRKKRTRFYLIASVSYVLAAAIFWSSHATVLFALAASYAVITLVVLCINMSWKISAHAAGVAGPLTAAAFIFGPQYALLLPLALFVGWSRVKLGSHNWYQVVAGMGVSALLTVLVFWVMR